MTAALIVYPMDVVKTYATVNNCKTTSSFTITKNIINKNGIQGLYKGLPVSIAGIMPLIGIRMATYDAIMAQTSQPTITYTMMAGAFAGLTATSICYPSDLLRRLMQLTGSSSRHNYNGTFDLIIQIWQKSGPSGFYKGF